MFLDGDTVAGIDGQSSKRTDFFEVEGEIGWSGFASVAADDAIVYESLTEGTAILRARKRDLDESQAIAKGVTAVHAFDGAHLLFSDASDTRLWNAGSGDVLALGIGRTLDALLGRSGAEIAYTTPVDVGEDDSSAGEPQQMVAVRGIDTPNGPTELIRGWHAFELHLLDEDILLYTALPFGGPERGELVLFDRRSSVTTTVAPEIRVLDSNPERRLIVGETVSAPSSGEPSVQLVICDASELETPTASPVGEPVSGHMTQARLLDDGDGLLASVSHTDGGSSLILFGLADGSQKTVFDTLDGTIRQLVLHPSAKLAFYTLQAEGVPGVPGARALWVCDTRSGECAPVLEASTGGLLQILGFVP